MTILTSVRNRIPALGKFCLIALLFYAGMEFVLLPIFPGPDFLSLGPCAGGLLALLLSARSRNSRLMVVAPGAFIGIVISLLQAGNSPFNSLCYPVLMSAE